LSNLRAKARVVESDVLVISLTGNFASSKLWPLYDKKVQDHNGAKHRDANVGGYGHLIALDHSYPSSFSHQNVLTLRTFRSKESTMKRSKIFLFAGLLITALAVTTILRSTSAAAPGPSASGHGTVLLQNTQGKTVRRQFSFSAKIRADGTVQGSAILHNPSFDPKYDAQFNITCLQIVGNRASFGGSIRKTTDPVFNDEFDAAFFTVFDNGSSNDTISEVFFDNVVEPSTCQFIGANDFPQIPIESGSVQVRP
jgi:hypothetical protein